MKAEEVRAGYAVLTQPENGAVVPFDKVTEPKIDQGGPLAAGEFTYVDISSVDNKLKRITEYKTLAVEAAPSRAKQRLKTGDVLVSMTRPNLNAVAIVPPELDGAVGSTGFHVLRATEATEPRWLYYAVQTKDFIAAMSELVQGALYPAVRPKDIRAYEIPHPPLDQQKRIVAEIEKQFSRLDEAVANLKRVKANLKRYKAAVLKAAVEGRLVETEAERARREGRTYETGAQLLQRIIETRRSQWQGKGKYKEPAAPDTTDLPELPEGWCWMALSQFAALENGDRSKNYPSRSAFIEQGIPFINAGHLEDGRIGMSEMNFISEDRYSLLRAGKVRENDLLFCLRGSLGKAAIVRNLRQGAIASSLVIVRPCEDVKPEYLLLYLMSTLAIEQIQLYDNGSAQPNLSAADLGKFVVPIPPVVDQQRIIAEVDRRLSLLRETEAQVDANIKRAERLSQSILQQAFAGGLIDINREKLCA